MTFRFRRSVRLFPGVRLNLSKSGITASIGGAPFTFNIGPRGLMSTAGVPGTGVSFRQHHGKTPKVSRAAYVLPALDSAPAPPLEREIRSAPTSEVSSEDLAPFLDLLREANAERRSIAASLPEAEDEETRLAIRYEKRRDGVLLKRLFPTQLRRFKEEAEEASAAVKELREGLKQATIQTEIQIPERLSDEFGIARQAFEALCRAHSIWDVTGERKVNSTRERSSATRLVSRELVRFELGRSEILAYNITVPILRNRNGGDLFLYPGFILLAETPSDFALVDLRDLTVASRTLQFNESETVPADAERVGTTWEKVNSDGTPDRRFRDNRQLPVMAYGSIRLQSAAGLDEEYHVSNAKLASRFASALSSLIAVAGEELGTNGVASPRVRPLRTDTGMFQPTLPADSPPWSETAKGILRTKPQGWEYLLFAEALRECIVRIRSAANAPAAPSSGPQGAPMEMMDRYGAILEQLQEDFTRIDTLVNRDLDEALAVGRTGNPEALHDVARSMSECYGKANEVIAQLQIESMSREYFVPLRHSLVSTVQRLRSQLEGFPDQITSSVLEAIRSAESGGSREAKLSLDLEVDHGLSAAMKTALNGLRTEVGLPPE